MPRVSEEHLERRRQQILDAALRCFRRKGFHETSMQDVFAESGLSAGAVYRYFKSKDELIGALAISAVGELRGVMAEAVHADTLLTPGELVQRVATEVVARSGPDGLVPLIPQAWALAVVKPDAAEYVRVAVHGLRGLWHEYVVRMRDEGWLAPDTDTDAVAKVIIGVMAGFILQHLLVGDVDPQSFARGADQLIPVRRSPAPND
ncbi:TetR/AcrR family transcriptional regulator [Nocardia puris]|uniref:TetR family transcriptional regulator n=1 Tax=Nocardia puris TaxID=208602 RepID=A0A366DE50_9NOCA|nr:TetR/AcrR family transcriptional regulator [Nocardia puris]MBF6212123.1 TetR/AcrR family transcriptional regulator [Nocardia puris]MBF6367149.1 TetR/AcrR family transcriptional regulator [Nocardia puris]RBO88331.1 TetR family transcriptional regulator [Nocardia puris]